MVDRSKCKRCLEKGIVTILTPENAYPRKDTYNKLHALCKSCYLESQKERTRAIANNGKKFTTLVRNGSRKPIRIFFDSMQEKKAFINSRKAISRCYRGNDTITTIRTGSTAAEGDPVFCDACGGTLRYDKRGFLCCEECSLVADIPVLYREVGLNMLRGRHAWNGEEADEMCQDTYYSTAYGRV